MLSARQKLAIRRAVSWVIFLLHPSLYQNSGDRGLPSVKLPGSGSYSLCTGFCGFPRGCGGLGSEVWILKDILMRNQKACVLILVSSVTEPWISPLTCLNLRVENEPQSVNTYKAFHVCWALPYVQVLRGWVPVFASSCPIQYGSSTCKWIIPLSCDTYY